MLIFARSASLPSNMDPAQRKEIDNRTKQQPMLVKDGKDRSPLNNLKSSKVRYQAFSKPIQTRIIMNMKNLKKQWTNRFQVPLCRSNFLISICKALMLVELGLASWQRPMWRRQFRSFSHRISRIENKANLERDLWLLLLLRQNEMMEEWLNSNLDLKISKGIQMEDKAARSGLIP